MRPLIATLLLLSLSAKSQIDTNVSFIVVARLPAHAAKQNWLLWVNNVGGVKPDGSCWITRLDFEGYRHCDIDGMNHVSPIHCDQLMRRWAAWNEFVGPYPCE